MANFCDTPYYRFFYSEEADERYKKIFPELYAPSPPKEKKPKIKKSERETVYRHILTTPLVEVLSISIGSLVDDGERPTICEIYGQISVVDTRLNDDGVIFNLFNKNEDNPQSMLLDEPLLLSPSSPNSVIVPSKYTRLDVLLFDRKAKNKVVAQGRVSLDKIGDECEVDHIQKVYGKDERSFADVHYTVFEYGVAATVDVLFFKEAENPHLSSEDTLPSVYADDDDDYSEYAEESSDEMDLSHYDSTDCGDGFVADVFGSVAVHSKVNYGSDKGYPSISLFDKSPTQGVQVKSGGFIPLSRSTVVVPAYASSLVIEVNLSDHNTETPIASGIIEFKPRGEYTFKKDLVGEHGRRVRVRVTWNHAYDQPLYRASEKKPKEVQDDDWDPTQALQVFSVAVHSKDFQPFSFYGTIDIKNMPISTSRIFSRDKSCPQVCAKGGELITIKGPYSRGPSSIGFLQIRSDLKDATTGAQISNGYASWDLLLISRWFDRRLCSVLRGEGGFVAVHYTVLHDEASVVVYAKLFGENLQGCVYGKIVARYGTYDYSTTYVDKYYQIVLFNNNEDGDSQQQPQSSGPNLHLLRPLVCLPRNSFLIIEAQLTLSAKSLNGRVHLKPNESDRLCGESWGIELHLKPV